MCRFCLLFFLLLFPFAFYAQGLADSVVTLKTVPVISFRSEEPIAGLKTESPDSLTKVFHRFSSMSSVLAENNFYIKNYGPGQLSVLSFRGGNAYHTGILWNGISIVDPMTGTGDLSLIKSCLFENISIRFGGSTSISGSGNLSGSILLSSKPTFNNGIDANIGVNYNSIGNLTTNGKISISNQKSSGTIRFFRENALNHYHYLKEGTEYIQTRASYLQYGLTGENSIITGEHSTLDLLIWYQYSDRNIPPTLYQTPNFAEQKDENIKLGLNWKKSGRTSLNIRSAFFDDQLYYNDRSLIVASDSKANTFLNEIEIRRLLDRQQQIGVTLNVTTIKARTIDYQGSRTLGRQWLNAFYLLTSTNEKWKFNISGRKEFSSLGNLPITMTTGVSRSLKSSLIRISYSKLHRNPTLNDLYWKPGGNRNLKAENGASLEAGIDLQISDLLFKQNNVHKLTMEGTFYSRTVNNWIEWTPIESLWTATNISQVWSRGIESSMTYQYAKNKFSTSIRIQSSYTLSTKENSILVNDPSLHKQLIYVPVNSYELNWNIFYKKIALRIIENYSSARYTTSDLSESLQSYFLTNIHLGYETKIYERSITLITSCDNIFNYDYSLVQNRPMPLRVINLGISMNILKKQI